MRIVLTPIDFSPATALVLDEAARLADAFAGYVILLHVVRPSEAVTEYGMDPASLAYLTMAFERAADRRLAEAKRELQRRGVAVQSLRLTGLPALDIIEQAEKLGADYIVLGSHGHTALYDLIVGGTAHAVLKRARCPVIVVPPQRKIPAAVEKNGAPVPELHAL